MNENQSNQIGPIIAILLILTLLIIGAVYHVTNNQKREAVGGAFSYINTINQS